MFVSFDTKEISGIPYRCDIATLQILPVKSNQIFHLFLLYFTDTRFFSWHQAQETGEHFWTVQETNVEVTRKMIQKNGKNTATLKEASGESTFVLNKIILVWEDLNQTIQRVFWLNLKSWKFRFAICSYFFNFFLEPISLVDCNWKIYSRTLQSR